jgi:hypothetical protein
MNKLRTMLILFTTSSIFFSCSGTENNGVPVNLRKNQTSQSADSVDIDDKKQTTRDKSLDVEKKSGDDGEIKSSLPENDSDLGKEFFIKEVEPLFQESCSECHAPPRFEVPVRGPISIFSYDLMKAKLTQGAASNDNQLYNKIRNIVEHTGGDKCRNGPNDVLCTVLNEWWEIETKQTANINLLVSKISGISPEGRVTGYAGDSSDTDASLEIRIYLDGDDTPVVTTFADRSGFDGGLSGEHAFSFELPNEFKQGEEHDLIIKAVISAGETSLMTAPFKFVAYSKNSDGETFFNNTIKGQLENTCGGCHSVSYNSQWASLISPPPDQGGIATSNKLILKASGNDHAGGNRCGGLNSSMCADFQTWWALEFGN